MEKYASYTLTDSPHQKIDLHRNFRSRSEILQTVNFFFSQLMEQKMGGITYDRQAALVTGRTFPELSAEEEKESRLNVPLPHFLQRRRVAHDEQQTDKKA